MSAPDSPAPASSDSIVRELRGLISSGRLIAGERLPPVRQVAADLGVAVGTAARAYRQLEEEGLVVTRRGGGTRVSESAHELPAEVLDAARQLLDRASRRGVSLDAVMDALRAMARTDDGVS